MKYVSFVLALCLSVAAALPAMAATPAPNPELTLVVTPVHKKTVEVAMVNLKQERTRIVLTSLDGEMLYFEDTVKNRNGYRRKLDLNALESGKYVLEVKQGSKVLSQVIVIDRKDAMWLSQVKG